MDLNELNKIIQSVMEEQHEDVHQHQQGIPGAFSKLLGRVSDLCFIAEDIPTVSDKLIGTILKGNIDSLDGHHPRCDMVGMRSSVCPCRYSP